MNRPLRVVIADDEPLALERLALAFREMEGAEVVGAAANGLQALEMITALRPDLAVLDIQMPGRTGLGVAAALPAEGRPEIVFLTAFDNHAVDAFDVEAADYVLKPLRLDRLRQAVMRASRRLQGAHRGAAEAPAPPAGLGGVADGFWVQGREGLVRVSLEQISWIEAAKDYVLLHTASRSYILRATMASIAERFPPPALLRVHRSALVRPGAVQALRSGGHVLILADGTAVAVGPSYQRHTRDWLTGRLPS